MRKLFLFIFIFSVYTSAQTAADELVNVKEIIPDIVLDLRYNTTNNFTHQKLYSTDEALFALGATKRLKLVQDSLRQITSYNGNTYPNGLGIKIFDAYRPRTIQYLMFEIFPDPVYVADPSSGSVHNRGGAIDLSIVDLLTGKELLMPTEFDWFGEEASHSYTDLPPEVIANRSLLLNMMTNVGGFSKYDSEWWHYTYPGSSSYPLLDFQMK